MAAPAARTGPDSGPLCSPAMALTAEEPVEPQPHADRSGRPPDGDTRRCGCAPAKDPNLADLIRRARHHQGRSAKQISIDVLGSAYAASRRRSAHGVDRAAGHRATPRRRATSTLKLPAPTEVSALRLTPERVRACPPTRPWSPIDLGDGPQVRRPLTADGGTQTISTASRRVTDTVKMSILDWSRRHRPHCPRLRSGQGARASQRSSPWTHAVLRSVPPTPRAKSRPSASTCRASKGPDRSPSRDSSSGCR